MHTLVHLSSLLSCATAATITYNWNIGWVRANADGQLSRPTVGVNGQWPCPAIQASVGDTVVVNVQNSLGNESTSLHFHGLHQQGTAGMDGPPGVTQCPIPPGSSYTYRFAVNQTGTYWWHSHSPGQYTDGLRGPLVVHDPAPPFKYDQELVVTLSDWYHDQMPTLLSYYLSVSQNPDGGEPVPYSGLMGEAQNPKYSVQPGKTYFVRIISMAAFSQFFLAFQGHDLTIVEVDGVYTVPTPAKHLYVATAQRYGVLLQTQASTSTNYPILASLDLNDFDSVPTYVDQNVTGWLVYNSAKPYPAANTNFQWQVIDDFDLIPSDKQPLLPSADVTIDLELQFFSEFNQNRAGYNNITWFSQKVPTLYTALSAPANLVNNAEIYGVNSNAYVVQYNHIVDIRVYNTDDGPHPLHIHGHQPQLIERTPAISSKRKRSPRPASLGGDGNVEQPQKRSSYPKTPLRRDTWLIAPSGYTTIRFRADNPGVWVFHCHMEWHVEAGLVATLVEAPLQLQQQQGKIDSSMASICKTQGIATTGNAAGNTKTWTDLSGAVTKPNGKFGSVYP